MTDASEMQEYYDARAGEYEQIYFRDNPPRRKEIADEIERLSELVDGREVLELACGTGYWTRAMAARARLLVSSDLSWPMLYEANKERGQNLSLVQANLNQLPFVPAGFDVVALGFWFSHHRREDYDPLFDRLSEPLRTGGRIWMIDNNPPAESTPAGETGGESIRVDEHGNNFKMRRLDNGETFVILKNYFDKEELEEKFSSRFKIERLTFDRYYWSVVLSYLEK